MNSRVWDGTKIASEWIIEQIKLLGYWQPKQLILLTILLRTILKEENGKLSAMHNAPWLEVNANL